jgi:hypothetical protein
MSDTIKHRHQTAIAPTGADVDNNEWNDSHVFAGGIDGQVVTRNSGAADGWAWASPSPIGQVLIEEHSAAVSASLDFKTRNKNGYTGATFQSDFDVYELQLIGLIPATNNIGISLRVTTDGGVSWVSSSDYSAVHRAMGTGGAGDLGTASATAFSIAAFVNLTNSASRGLSGTLKFFDPLTTARFKAISGTVVFWDTGPTFVEEHTSGSYNQTTAINGFQLFAGSGNLTSGTARIYGIAK